MHGLFTDYNDHSKIPEWLKEKKATKRKPPNYYRADKKIEKLKDILHT